MADKTDYFKAFCRVSRALGTTLSKDEILNLVVESAIDSLNGKAACLFLSDEEEDLFVPVAQKGLSDSYLHARPYQARAVVDNLLRGGYLAIRDATTDPRLEHHEAKRAEGIASILVVPVMLKDKAIGVLSLYSATPRDFSEDEIEFLAALAEQGGMAIQNAQLFERLKVNAQLFFDLAANLNSSLDIKKIFHILTSQVADALGMKAVSVRLLNTKSRTLDLMASYGLSEEYLNKGPVFAEDSMGLCLNGESVEIKAAERLQYRDETLREGIASLLCVPIRAGDEVIGIMKIYSAREQDFSQDVLTLVNALAHQGGQAIQNASLYLLLQEDKKNLEQEIWTHKTWF
jgi:GAF domain-containing protein